MINRTKILGVVFMVWSASFGSPAIAHDTDAEFAAKVKSYILENPEVILEAMTALGERERMAAQGEAIAGFPGLFSEPSVLGMGNPEAPVKVVEFFDYLCAPCKAMHPGLVDLVERVPQIHIEMRQLPILSPGSERGARFALAVKDVAGPDAYRRVHDQLWTLRGPLSYGSFEKIATAEELDWGAVKKAMDSETVSARIDENRNIAIALELLGTPAFLTSNSISFGQSDIDALAKVWLSQ